MKKELRAYCWSDVQLLTQGCLKFRKDILEFTKKENDVGVDPFRVAITIASLCNFIFRKYTMKSKSIAIDNANVRQQTNNALNLSFLHFFC